MPCDRVFENVVFEVSFLLLAIRKDHAAQSVLYASNPLTFVHATISPQHLTVALSLVLLVISFIDVARCPGENAFAVLLVLLIFTLVCVAGLDVSGATPFTPTVFFAFEEVTCVDLTSGPNVLAFALGFTVEVIARVYIPICKGVCALAMLQAHIPLTFISVSVRPVMDTISMCFGRGPLTYIGVILYTLPDAVALFDSLVPLSIIHLAIFPGVNTLSVGLTILELAEVSVPIWVALKSLAVAQIVLPETFVLTSISILHDTFTMTFSIYDRSKIDSILIFDFFKTIYLLNGLEVHLIGLQLDVLRQQGIIGQFSIAHWF